MVVALIIIGIFFLAFFITLCVIIFKLFCRIMRHWKEAEEIKAENEKKSEEFERKSEERRKAFEEFRRKNFPD